MYIPPAWERLQFDQWNRMVKGLVEVWDQAEVMGVEESLEWHLRNDMDGQLAALLSRVGEHEEERAHSEPCRHQETSAISPCPLLAKRENQDLAAYMRSTQEGLEPTSEAYDGARLLRECLLWIEQFAEEKGLATQDVRRILCEAIAVYTTSDELLHSFPPLVS